MLFLDKNIEVLRANYSKSHLKNIKRAKNNKLCISLEPDCVEKFCLNKQNLAYGYMTKKQFDLEYSIIKKSLALKKVKFFLLKEKMGIVVLYL